MSQQRPAFPTSRISIVVTWQVWFVAGEPGQEPVGPQQLTFAHPATGQPVVWQDPGEVGSRLNTILLDVDAGRLFLVGLAPTGPDYGGFGCPTPQYIVFRYDAGTWARIPLGELPTRFAQSNLLAYPGKEFLHGVKNFVTAAQVAAHFAAVRQHADTAHYGQIDRRIRNPMAFGCDRGAIERVYGVEKYYEWRKSGTWLDKTDAEIRTLLRPKSEGTKP
jgi:hypothetical protein